MLSVNRLPGPFGVEVTGLDLAKDNNSQTIAALTALLYEHRFLAIRDQKLTEDQYLAFGRQWGRPHPHLLSHKRMPGYPEMMTIGNTQKRAKGDNPAVFWHTDQPYEAVPASCTMLYSILSPVVGGETLLADMAAAYDALDDETKKRIDGYVCMHLYGAASGRDGELTASVLISDDQRRAAPPVPHPLVLPHPVTGRKALYAVGGTPFAIRGMEDDKARALLDELKRHALQPQFVYKHKYKVGDIGIWDTLATMHSATPLPQATCLEDSRLLWRISCKGLPAVVEQRLAQQGRVVA